MDNKEIETLLRVHNIKPSQHRMHVYKYLYDNKNHPSVDMIYRELINEIPTLSKTTLYNILGLFVERGLVTLITLEENENRYDANTLLHGHLKCTNCGQIYDIAITLSAFNIIDKDEFEINECQIYFKGLCRNCIKKPIF